MPTPIALALAACHRVIIDGSTNRRSLIDIFSSLQVRDLGQEQEFSLFARLTNGRGTAKIALSCLDLANGNQIYQQTDDLTFPDPLAVINLHARIRITFPAAGHFEFVLQADGDPIAQQRIRVYT